MFTSCNQTLGILTLALALLVPGQSCASEAEWRVHTEAGTTAYRAGDFRVAVTRLEAALREAESFGVVDLRLATSLSNLALLYRVQGRYAETEPLYRRSLGIYEQALGADHPYAAIALNNLAALYQTQGFYAKAEPLYQRSLGIFEKALDPDPTDLANSLNNLAALYQAQGRYREAEPLHSRSLGIFEKALGPDHPDVASPINNLAHLYQEQGRYTDAEPLYRHSLRIYERAFGPDHPDVAKSLNNLAALYQTQGLYAEADPLYQRSLGIVEKVFGPDHPDVATGINNLANLYEAQGRYADAERLFQHALGVYEKALGPDHPAVASSLNNMASLYQTQGRYWDAEALYQRSLGIREKTLNSDHPDVALSLNNLAGLYQAQGRYGDVEPLYLRSLAIREKSFGPNHRDVASALNNLAELYQAQGRYAEAEALHRRSLDVSAKALGPNHPDVAVSLNNLAAFFQKQGIYAEAESLHRRSLAIREISLGPNHQDVANSLNNLAELFRTQSRYVDAEPLYRRSLGIFEQSLGPNHPIVSTTLNNLATLYRAQGKFDEALALVRRMSSALALRFVADKRSPGPGLRAEQVTRAGQFELHVSLLAETLKHSPKMRAEVTREGFDIAQLARASDTADQLAKMAARYASGSDALAQLVRKRQDALARRQLLDLQIVQAAGQRGNESLAAKLRAEDSEVSRVVAALDDRLEHEYPQYRELTNPKPLELAAAQELLAADEALVLMLVSDNESFLWALRRDDAGFFKLPIKRTELVGIVKELRSQLDFDPSKPERILSQPFDVATAHELYRRILAPAEALLATAKRLIVIPDGAMQSLPPGVLVVKSPTKPVASFAGLTEVPWLAKKYTITVLPAAGSLRALRQLAKLPTSQEPFIGFGDPVLEGRGEGERRMSVPALYSRGAVADTNEVRKLARLPESARELRAIAATLKAPATSIRLGSTATERAVKEADLTRYRNLAFATHGLMAGEFKGLAEPALVFTPPEKGSELDDGLLTAGEISQLKLDADWVVLSACNTAAPDGTPGAEGLSGLARAFFYAGARSLLVSHWAVSSDAAVAITTRMFEEYAKGVPKAEALRRSLLAMAEQRDRPYFAHPAFWAPFVLVGEGNTDWKK